MKLLFMLVASLVMVNTAYAKKNIAPNFQEIADWNNFDFVMKAAEEQNKRIGWSYLISGVLVGIGGTMAAQNSSDTAANMVFGLSAGFGIAASGYGALRLLNGNDYTAFYNTLRESSLTPTQRDELVKNYIELIREREKNIRITRIVSNVIIGGLSFYSASREEDKNSKTFFQIIGTVSFAIALTYTF
jgi:hypothetical protein